MVVLMLALSYCYLASSVQPLFFLIKEEKIVFLKLSMKNLSWKLSSVITAFRVGNRQYFSMVCALIDVRNDIKRGTTRLRLVVSLQSFEHFDVIFMFDKDIDHVKLMSICFFNNVDRFDVHLRKSFS